MREFGLDSDSYLWLFLFSGLLLFSCSTAPESTQWKVVYKSDKSGSTLVGDKAELIKAIRSGASVKIGWGTKGKNHSIEHLSEPIWLAILDEKEVIAHLDPQVLSVVKWDELSADYSDSTKLKEEWRVVITTKGEFDAIWYDRQSNRVIKRIPQNHVMTWYIRGTGDNPNAKPLFVE